MIGLELLEDGHHRWLAVVRRDGVPVLARHHDDRETAVDHARRGMARLRRLPEAYVVGERLRAERIAACEPEEGPDDPRTGE
jgi:hypothetical protein